MFCVCDGIVFIRVPIDFKEFIVLLALFIKDLSRRQNLYRPFILPFISLEHAISFYNKHLVKFIRAFFFIVL